MALKQPESLLNLSSRALGSFIAERALFVLEKDRQQARNVANVDENIDDDYIDDDYIDDDYIDDDNNKYLESSIQEFSKHFDTNIPLTIHNLVTYDTLQYIKKKDDLMLWNMDNLVFRMALRNHVTKFDFTDWPWVSSMFDQYLSKLEHLEVLNINYIDNGNLSYILEGIRVMKKLEKFHFNSCSCFNDIVEVLCNNCPLTSLTLKHYSINDSSVSHLLKLHNLKELKIYDTKISELGAKQLLLGLPQLKTFQGPSKFSVGNVCDITTSLESVELMFPSQQTVENLTLFCPSVINLKLYTFDPLDFSNVANFDYLTTLYIRAPYFYSCNIHTILQRRGHQITNLGLSDMRDISMEILLNIVNESCPNLKNLCITFIPSNVGIDVFPTQIQQPFQNLEFVILDSYVGDKTSCFIYLLSTCLNIRQVYIRPVNKLCDEDIDRILSCNPLVHLQELCVEDNKLTVKSFYKLLSSCRQLRYIGNVNCWWAVPDSELEKLETYIKKNNLNVELVGSYTCVSHYPHLGKKKRVSVMKPEYSELPQGLLYMYKSVPDFTFAE